MPNTYTVTVRQLIKEMDPKAFAELVVCELDKVANEARQSAEQVAGAAGLGQPLTTDGRSFADVPISDICTAESTGCSKALVTRTLSCLSYSHIETLRDLAEFVAKHPKFAWPARRGILCKPNFGKKGLDECLIPSLEAVLAPEVFQQHFGGLKK